jgi:hypothetical protein
MARSDLSHLRSGWRLVVERVSQARAAHPAGVRSIRRITPYLSRDSVFFFSRATVEFSPCANAIRCRVADRSSDDRSHRSSLMQFTLASLSTFPEERSAFNGSNSSPVYIYFRKTALARINNARFSFTQP